MKGTYSGEEQAVRERSTSKNSGNNSATGNTGQSEGESVDKYCAMKVIINNFSLDGGNNSDVGCTYISAGYSSARGYNIYGSSGHE